MADNRDNREIEEKTERREKRRMRLGYAMCGSFCTLARSIEELEKLAGIGWELVPIVNDSVFSTDTRFGAAADIVSRIEGICGSEVIHTIERAEPLGPKNPLDLLVIAPCTGNTLAKMAAGITDSAVTMAAKAHMRTGRPLVIALSTNDALSGNLHSIATVSMRKNVFFVPLGQDDPVHKPYSLVADLGFLRNTLFSALSGIQLQPVILGAPREKS